MATNQGVYQVAMREAHALAWALKWEAASQKYREALAVYPDDPTARLSLAIALDKTGRLAEALQEYIAARELLPRDALVVARIAELHLRLGQHTEAVYALLALARLHSASGERPKAMDALRQALECSAGRRRLLLAVKEAVASVGIGELLGEVEEALAQAPPDEPGTERSAEGSARSESGRQPASAKPDSRPSAVHERGAEMLVPLVGAIPPDDDPAQRLAAAERHAEEGRRAAAVTDYLRATELLSDAESAVAARRAASALASGWLLGDLEEVAALEPAERAVVVDAMAASHRHLERGLLGAALDESLRAVGYGSGYLPAHLRLADVYREMGLVDRARERSLAVAELYELRGEHRRAAVVLRRQLAIEPQDSALWERLSRCLLATGDVDQAADGLFSWSDSLLSAGDVEAALERQREAIRLAPRADRWLKHGLLLENAGKVEEALAAFDTARELAPAEEFVAAAQSRCQALLGRWPAMEANLQAVLAALPDDPLLAEEALGKYRAALTRWGDDPGLHYCLGMSLRASGQHEEAAAHLSLAAEHESRPGRLARYHLATWELAVGQTDRALAHLRAVGAPTTAADDADRSLSTAAYRTLADLCSRASDWAGTAEALAALLDADPDDETLYPRLAEAHLRQGQPSAALETLSRLADRYQSRHEYERALAICQGMVQFMPDDPTPREKLGRLYLEMGRREEGLAELKQVVDLQLEHGQDEKAAANLRAMLDASRQSDPQLALALRERLAALRPTDVELRRELVAAYLKAGRSVRALAEARAIGDYLVGEGRLDEGLQACQLVVRLDPWSLPDQVRLADVLAKLGRTRDAVATLERVLARDPANQEALAGIASLRGKITVEDSGGSGDAAS